MYGNCEKGETRNQLTRIAWLPAFGGGSVEVTTVNGIAGKLQAVSAEIEKLPGEIRRYAYPSAGALQLPDSKGYGQAQHARLWRFPPYGTLQGADKIRVGEISIWEKQKGC